MLNICATSPEADKGPILVEDGVGVNSGVGDPEVGVAVGPLLVGVADPVGVGVDVRVGVVPPPGVLVLGSAVRVGDGVLVSTDGDVGVTDGDTGVGVLVGTVGVGVSVAGGPK